MKKKLTNYEAKTFYKCIINNETKMNKAISLSKSM